ncbi:hypothetical protein CDAR_517081 [Caerostris darwini]|uniref:Uncharacterized protein n=1 Tax=Caerostris darwini TaxID=1538125 RepID=A0AAV4W4S3_9ARAC|nr:hypothetical protein CDAR_517081 [Caerostris darwini]
MAAQRIVRNVVEIHSGHDYQVSFNATVSPGLFAKLETTEIQIDCPNRIAWTMEILLSNVGSNMVLARGKLNRNDEQVGHISVGVNFKVCDSYGEKLYDVLSNDSNHKIQLVPPCYSFLQLFNTSSIPNDEIHLCLQVTIDDGCDALPILTHAIQNLKVIH